MDRVQRIRIKLALIFLGILVLVMLITLKIDKLEEIEQKNGEYIPFYKAELLLTTVEPKLKEQDAFLLLGEEGEEFLTYGQYLEICKLLQKDETQYPLFEKQYKEEHFVIKEDFETMYDVFLTAFDTEKRMTLQQLTILGTPDNVIETTGGSSVEPEEKTTEEKTLVTEQGTFPVLDKELENYRFQTVEVYLYDNRVVTDKQMINTEYYMKNIWIAEADKEELRLFTGVREMIVLPEAIEEELKDKLLREQIADLEFEKGVLTGAEVKTDKINGKVLSIKEESLTLEGKGEFTIDEEFRAYRLYGKLEEIGKSDLIVGYDFTDFVIENGKICAALVVKEEKMENIRVFIKASDYSGMFHEKAEFTCDTDFTVTYGIAEEQKTEEYKAGDIVVLEKDSPCFKDKRVYIKPSALTGKTTLLHMNRSQGNPQYRGNLELCLEKENLFIINEVLLEEYLYSVVPSEMPAGYPKEALKAQAVCARTYAYGKMLHSSLADYGAHVDDSTTYQVYNNIAEKEAATTAVKETAGEMLTFDGMPIGAYYYSTSCGFGTTAQIWKSGNPDIPYLQSKEISSEESGYTPEDLQEEETFEAYIKEIPKAAYEQSEGWFRWIYTVKQADSSKIEEMLKKRYEANEKLILTQNKEKEYESKDIGNIGEITDIYVEKRGSGGVIDELIIETKKKKIKVITEHNIRYVLNDGSAKVIRQDGSEAASPNLLPSAFFSISVDKEEGNVVGYSLTGGGFGHGVGMSQNGARSMAAKGMSYQDILLFFYQGSSLESAYERDGYSS